MSIPKVFWIALAIFQIAFGTTVFLVTRSYYINEEQPVTPTSLDIQSMNSLGASVNTGLPLNPAQARTPEALARLADTHFSNRQYDAAVVLYEQLLPQDPANVDILNNLALTLHYVGRSDDALRRIEEGIAVDASHQRIRLTQGFVLSQLGRSTEAVAALNRAIELNSASEIADSARRMLSDIANP